MAALAGQAWAILIVDEDDSVRKGLSRLMSAAGFAVRAFATAEGFFRDCGAATQACVLMDITKPRMSGLQIRTRLADQDIDLPVIAISARDDEEARMTARALGARFFLRKPLDDRALLDAIAWVTGARV
jgi:FixJ family two-component response regulator